MKTVAVIGANGQLGSDIVKVFSKGWKVYTLLHKDVEIKEKKSVFRVLRKIKAQVIINTAAYHQLNECELNPLEAWRVNAVGVKNLAEWSKENKVSLVHISTNYVFGGESGRKRPYKENDPVWPQSTYAITKLAGEFLLRSITPRHFVIRTAGLYGVAGSSVKGSNFVDNVIDKAKRKETINMVSDQVLSPTYTRNLAENLERLVKTNKFGLYHMTSKRSCSWYEFTRYTLKQTNLKTKVVPIKTDDQASGVIRPRYSVLTNSRLRGLSLDNMNPWKKSLKLYLKEKGYLAD